MGTTGKWLLIGLAAMLVAAVPGCAVTDPSGEPLTAFDDVLLTGPTGSIACDAVTVDPTKDNLIRRDHSLLIPPQTNWNGAAISLRELPPNYVGVRVLPSGQQFNPSAILTISFDHCPPGVTGPFKIYLREGSGWTKLEASYLSPDYPRAVSVDRATASDYALGAN